MNFDNLFSGIPNETPSEEESETPIEVIREELLSLSEKGKLNYAPKYIQKANRDTLEKIKRRYDRKQLELTNELVTDMVISKYAEVLNHFKIIRNPIKLEQKLKENDLVKKEVKNLVGDLTPHIPYVGLFCGGLITFTQAVDERNDPSNETNESPDGKMKEPPDVDLNF